MNRQVKAIILGSLAEFMRRSPTIFTGPAAPKNIIPGGRETALQAAKEKRERRRLKCLKGKESK